MNINVTATKVTITSENLIMNKGEYHINDCNFTFSQEYTNLVKRAVFTTSSGKNYVVEIENDTCVIPEQVLRFSDKCILGVYAYANEEDELSLRYSPEPTTFKLQKGSYVSDAEDYLPARPIKDLIEEFDEHVVDKTEEFDNHVTDKTEEFDSHVTDKIEEFDINAENKTNTLNQIAEGIEDMATAIQFATFEVDNNMDLYIVQADKLINTNFIFNQETGGLEVMIANE